MPTRHAEGICRLAEIYGHKENIPTQGIEMPSTKI